MHIWVKNIILYHYLKIHKPFSPKNEIPKQQLQEETPVTTDTWDEPAKCARFIERFTSHTLGDAEITHLEDYTRNDLEGIIQLLHGYYTQLIQDNPTETRETTKCTADDVLTSMTLASTTHRDEQGDLILSDELWGLVKNSPQLLNLLIRTETSQSLPQGPRTPSESHVDLVGCGPHPPLPTDLRNPETK
jgi:hypothetical protein